MDSLFEKFSLYDFFNLIISGAVFLIGLHLMGFAPLEFIINDINIPENNIILLSMILLLCYVIGAELQGIELFLERKNIYKFQSEMIRNFLNENSNAIRNKEKCKVYRKKAKIFFKNKNIKISDEKFSEDQCEYFYAYCSYFIQIKEQNTKTEKMRGLKGLSSLLTLGFTILFIIGMFRNVYLLGKGLNLHEMSISLTSTAAFFILAVSSYYRMKVTITNWVRMVLGTYDACSDEDNKKD